MDHSYLFSALRFSHKETLNFSRQNSISSVIGITTEYDDLLTVSLGYAWNNAKSGWKTQELYYDCIDGWTLNMTLDTGVFLIGYQTALEHGIGYGKLALDVLSFTGESYWKETNVSYSIGMVFQLNNTFFANDIAIPIKGTRWDIYLSDRYFSGDPHSRIGKLDLITIFIQDTRDPTADSILEENTILSYWIKMLSSNHMQRLALD